jgi:hypothetical protein
VLEYCVFHHFITPFGFTAELSTLIRSRLVAYLRRTRHNISDDVILAPRTGNLDLGNLCAVPVHAQALVHGGHLIRSTSQGYEASDWINPRHGSTHGGSRRSRGLSSAGRRWRLVSLISRAAGQDQREQEYSGQ